MFSIWKSRLTHVKKSFCTYDWGMSHSPRSPATHIQTIKQTHNIYAHMHRHSLVYTHIYAHTFMWCDGVIWSLTTCVCTHMHTDVQGERIFIGDVAESFFFVKFNRCVCIVGVYRVHACTYRLTFAYKSHTRVRVLCDNRSLRVRISDVHVCVTIYDWNDGISVRSREAKTLCEV